MITETELRDALVRQAKTYEVPPHDLLSLRATALRRRRVTRLRYGGIAAAGLLVVAVAWGRPGGDPVGRPGGDPVVVQPADRDSDVTISPSCLPPGQAPPVPDSPFAGDGFLSDEAVTSTTPGGRSCTLVLRYWFHRFGAGSGLDPTPGLSGMVWLYSDGRLIVDTATEKDWFVQWERRLTSAGVERLRTAVVSMLDESASRQPDGFEAKIHYGAGIFYPKDPQALVRRLTDQSWLPNDAWVTKSPSVYRAAWYLVCYEMPRNGAVVQTAVRGLPSGARDVLESRVWTALPPDAETGVARSQCVVLSRGDATVLVEALGGDIDVGTANAFPEGLGGPARQFSVHALMPDGTSGAHGD